MRPTNDPLKGDIIFWNHTYDRNKTCFLGDDDQPTHAGIVDEVNIDGQGTVTFIHASSAGVAHSLKMNIEQPTNTQMNSFLTNRWNKCERCGSNESCPATNICQEGYKQINQCPLNDWEDYGHLAGELFNGYGTMRNTIPALLGGN